MDALSREQELAGGGDPARGSFFDTHPTTPDRANKGREYAKTLDVAPANPIVPDRNAFLEMLDGLVLGQSASAGVFLENRFVHPDLGFALTFPKGWQHQNSPMAVVAQPEDQSALMALQLAGEGDDPNAAADRIAAKVPLSSRSSTTINGYDAVTAATSVAEQGQEIYVALAWIAKDGLIYQILGATSPMGWERHRPTFEKVTKSFGAPTPKELAAVYENRLRLVDAKRGQTVGDIAKSSGNQWSAAKTAAANAMKSSTKLSGGESIKINRREPYVQ
jgi:predicted Zn-dependent protease